MSPEDTEKRRDHRRAARTYDSPREQRENELKALRRRFLILDERGESNLFFIVARYSFYSEVLQLPYNEAHKVRQGRVIKRTKEIYEIIRPGLGETTAEAHRPNVA